MNRACSGIVVLAALLTFADDAAALPMYAMRSARTCANCHVSPTLESKKGWNNPKWWKRKCTMSCVGCHVNPTGGGLRNVSGRYYGQSTLAMLPTQQRSYSDHGRELAPRSLIALIQRIARGNRPPPFAGRRRAKPAPRPVPSTMPNAPTSAPTSAPSAAGAQTPEPKSSAAATSSMAPRTVPSNYQEVQRGIGAGASGGFATVGKSLNGSPQGEYAFWDGRYADLNADPLLMAGADVRLAYWSGAPSIFPMQLDLHGALHPMEHVTLMATASLRGRAGGFQSTLQQERFPLFARNAFLMVHELPAMAYVKAGIFLPSFGTHIDDHTSLIRNFFEMDVSQAEDTVLGVEVGLAPNYPFASVSVFRNLSPPDVPEGTDPGFGVALNLGWRDILWHLTAHGMIKRRDLAARGNLMAGGFGWGFNPFAISNSLPLTYMGEFSAGRVQRAGTGSQATVIAMYHELWVTIFNGLSLRAKYELGSRDVEADNALEQRLSFLLDLGIVPGMTMIAGTRTSLASHTTGDTDVMVQAHLWF